MNVVLDESGDVERVVLRIIEEELSRSEAGRESLQNPQIETQSGDNESFPHRADFADPDVIDDGLFDDYDDGEAIESDIDEEQALSSAR